MNALETVKQIAAEREGKTLVLTPQEIKVLVEYIPEARDMAYEAYDDTGAETLENIFERIAGRKYGSG